MSYRPLYEDPTYDDDGQCVDEDAVQDPGDLEYDEDLGEWIDNSSYDPHDTINS
jgi:hypothetical protein